MRLQLFLKLKRSIAYIAQLDGAKVFPRRIATQVGPLAALYRAP